MSQDTGGMTPTCRYDSHDRKRDGIVDFVEYTTSGTDEQSEGGSPLLFR